MTIMASKRKLAPRLAVKCPVRLPNAFASHSSRGISTLFYPVCLHASRNIAQSPHER